MAKTKKIVREIEVEIGFPRNLYKNGGPLVWGKKIHKYSTVLVENESEYDEAIKAGYLDNFSEAIFGKVTDKKKVVEDNDDF